MPTFIGLLRVLSCTYTRGRPYVCNGIPGIECWTSAVYWPLVLIAILALVLYAYRAVPCLFKFQIDDRDIAGLEIILQPDFVVFFTFYKMVLSVLSVFFAAFVLEYAVMLFLVSLAMFCMVCFKQRSSINDWPSSIEDINRVFRYGCCFTSLCSFIAVVTVLVNDEKATKQVRSS